MANVCSHNTLTSSSELPSLLLVSTVATERGKTSRNFREWETQHPSNNLSQQVRDQSIPQICFLCALSGTAQHSAFCPTVPIATHTLAFHPAVRDHRISFPSRASRRYTTSRLSLLHAITPRSTLDSRHLLSLKLITSASNSRRISSTSSLSGNRPEVVENPCARIPETCNCTREEQICPLSTVCLCSRYLVAALAITLPGDQPTIHTCELSHEPFSALFSLFDPASLETSLPGVLLSIALSPRRELPCGVVV